MFDNDSFTPELDKLEEIAREATPGLWRNRYDGYGDSWIETADVPLTSRHLPAGKMIALFDNYIEPEDRLFAATFCPATVLALIHLARKAK